MRKGMSVVVWEGKGVDLGWYWRWSGERLREFGREEREREGRGVCE